MSDSTAKQAALSDLLDGLGRVVVAYSGGVDSAFLTAVAHDTLGKNCLAVTAVSPSLARSELEQATALAAERGWQHICVATGEIDRAEYRRNAPDRCYWCKSELYDVLAPIAAERGATVVTGTNVDDLGEHRPGLRAARERSVAAPLVEAGLSKSEIRELSAARGLPTASKPASPCLASRFAYGVEVTRGSLARVEAAEAFVASLGFEVFRVRDHGDSARVEVLPEEIERAAQEAEAIAEALMGLGYRYVSLDLRGFRSGAMNEILPPDQLWARSRSYNDQERAQS